MVFRVQEYVGPYNQFIGVDTSVTLGHALSALRSLAHDGICRRILDEDTMDVWTIDQAGNSMVARATPENPRPKYPNVHELREIEAAVRLRMLNSDDA